MVSQKHPLDETIAVNTLQILIYRVCWYLPMFCPQCGTLAFPSPSGDINCTNYKCGYQGPANLKVKGADGKVKFSGGTVGAMRVPSAASEGCAV